MKMYFITKNEDKIETLEFDEEQIHADLLVQAKELNIPNFETMSTKELEEAIEKLQSEKQVSDDELDLDDEEEVELDVTPYGKKPSKFENKADREYRLYSCGKEHLCPNCERAYADKCPKVAHTIKNELDGYSFIKEGAQVIKDGYIEKFFVASCTDFIRDDEAKREKLRQDIQRMNLLLQRSPKNEEEVKPVRYQRKRQIIK